MGNFRFISLFFFLVILSNNAFSFFLGPQIVYKDYKETLPLDLKCEDKGVLEGFRGGLSFSLAKLIYGEISVDYAKGKTKYSGIHKDILTDQYYSFHSKTNNILINAEGNLGIALSAKKISIKPFWGVGYHLWERELIDYSETYNWLYINFGAVLAIHITPSWDIGLDVRGMQPKFSKIEIEELNPWNQDMSLFNEMQYAIKIYNKFSISFLNLYLAGFYKNMKIGATKKSDDNYFSARSSIDKIFGAEVILEVNF